MIDLVYLSGGKAGLLGLLVGALLGGAARMGDFCTLAALETAMLGRDYRQLHIWGIALGVAILATALADAAGLIAIGHSIYHAIAWNPLASIGGGLLFGYGMAMAGNCGFGALLRAGSGDIRSVIIVAALGISSYFTLSGPLGPLRDLVFPQQPAAGPGGIANDLAGWTGLPPLGFALAIGAVLIVAGLRHPRVAGSAVTIACAAVVGLSVTLGFVGTALLSEGGLAANTIEGPSFTVPVGRTILYLMTATGMLPSFSVGVVFGTFAGAAMVSVWRHSFRWEACDDPRELGRQLFGAVLMGIGGVIAMGCTIGQGLTGFATLAWSGPVTLAAIAAGAMGGLLQLVRGDLI
ncbi:hypothetical protein SAMN04487972_10949 [Paracoccus halophilus]|uniref:YeeE/YedE family protein n=1 Tax=Paracoccus halophilus TaxID=376733 RepID=A0A099F1U5_9RHOB|nr:YeeE/YedE family protein [Paracoccus halophilus]KGJ04243.1 YeeE/YedE family protein [Paracoccus halophilus]SFA52076.1 hypothetical protein SAMN04487972_10949 [Paracoccus halophilus]